MTVEQHGASVEEAQRRAIHAEAAHLTAWLRDVDLGGGPDPREAFRVRSHAFGASLMAATIGAARRHLTAHPHETDEHFKRLAAEASTIESGLPLHLRRLWELHYVDGKTLDDYAVAASSDPSRARAHYQELIMALVMPVHAAAARWQDADATATAAS
jgi:hypothetical protein